MNNPPEGMTSPAVRSEIRATEAPNEVHQPRPPRLNVLKTEKGVASLDFDAEDKTAAARQLVASLGNCDPDFASGVIRQLLDGARSGPEANSSDLNFALQVIGAIKPQNELEATLAVQMAAVHVAAMRCMRMMHNAELLTQLEVHERTSSRLMRTFALQMETLRKMRSGGEQRVIVKHVTVNEGGNAIVGNVATSAGGRGAQKT